jgi:hypothetical protein
MTRNARFPEQKSVTSSRKRLIAALAFVLPVAALAASPVMAASTHKAKAHHSSVHKVSHKTFHKSKGQSHTS